MIVASCIGTFGVDNFAPKPIVETGVAAATLLVDLQTKLEIK